jgi:hypothetical protein
MITVYLYLPVWCMPTCIMIAYKHYVCLPVHTMSATCTTWCLAIRMSAYLPVCLPVGYLATCVIPSYLSAKLYYVCLTIWCLPTCLMLSNLYDVCLPVRCFLTCMMSATVWCLLNCMRSSYLHYVCSTGWCLPTFYDFFLLLLCLLDCMVSVYLYGVFLPVWR